MTVLIIGGAGFIGSSFVRLYEKPIVYDKLTYAGRMENLKGVECDFIRGDVASPFLEEIVRRYRPDIVVNFAAESHVDRSINDPWRFVHTNIEGPINVLDLARRYDFRYVHISTDEVYGESEADELSPVNPSSPYSSSKASADLFVKSYIRTYGVDALIVRPSNAYGPRQYPEKFIPKAIIRTIMGLHVPLYGDGTQRRNWIYVEDLSRIIKDIAEHGKSGEVYNAAGSGTLENKQVLEEIGKHVKVSIRRVEDRPGHDVIYAMRNTKLKYELTPFDKGIAMTVDWYVKNEWWWRPLIGDDYFSKDEPWRINQEPVFRQADH